MFCPKCKFDFCWRCMFSYKRYQHDPRNPDCEFVSFMVGLQYTSFILVPVLPLIYHFAKTNQQLFGDIVYFVSILVVFLGILWCFGVQMCLLHDYYKFKITHELKYIPLLWIPIVLFLFVTQVDEFADKAF